MNDTNFFITIEGTEVPIHFFSSDHHVGHVNIARLVKRAFDNTESTDDMDNSLVATWNSVITDDHNVLVPGDIALGNIEVSLDKWKEFKGNKFLIPGNHDRLASIKSVTHREKYLPMYKDAGFTILPETIDLFLRRENGEVLEMVASHYPYSGDSQFVSRYDWLRPVDEGKLLIHGHTHSALATDEDKMPRQYHVGVDAHGFAPVPAATIEEWANQND